MFLRYRIRGRQNPLKRVQKQVNRQVIWYEKWQYATHEQVIGVGAEPTNLEQFHEVKELAVNIPTDLHSRKVRHEMRRSDRHSV